MYVFSECPRDPRVGVDVRPYTYVMSVSGGTQKKGNHVWVGTFLEGPGV